MNHISRKEVSNSSLWETRVTCTEKEVPAFWNVDEKSWLLHYYLRPKLLPAQAFTSSFPVIVIYVQVLA